MTQETTDLLLLVLGPMIPLLTWLFVSQLLAWDRDRRADIESAEADRDDEWRWDWDFWSQLTDDPNPNTRALAIQMQGFLVNTRPVTA